MYHKKCCIVSAKLSYSSFFTIISSDETPISGKATAVWLMQDYRGKITHRLYGKNAMPQRLNDYSLILKNYSRLPRRLLPKFSELRPFTNCIEIGHELASNKKSGKPTERSPDSHTN